MKHIMMVKGHELTDVLDSLRETWRKDVCSLLFFFLDLSCSHGGVILDACARRLE